MPVGWAVFRHAGGMFDIRRGFHKTFRFTEEFLLGAFFALCPDLTIKNASSNRLLSIFRTTTTRLAHPFIMIFLSLSPANVGYFYF